jgi:hypothetical protein
MSLPLGTRMIRVDDGRQGSIELAAPPGAEAPVEHRVVYYDRGERVIASKLEKWVEDAPPTKKLADGEMRFVAAWADAVLEAIEKHQPFRFWETVNPERPPHDPAFRELVLGYLRKRI